MVAGHAGFCHGVGHVLFQRFNLAHRFGGHHHEIIGEHCQLPQVQHHDVRGQLVGSHVHGQAGHVGRGESFGSCHIVRCLVIGDLRRFGVGLDGYHNLTVSV